MVEIPMLLLHYLAVVLQQFRNGSQKLGFNWYLVTQLSGRTYWK